MIKLLTLLFLSTLGAQLLGQSDAIASTFELNNTSYNADHSYRSANYELLLDDAQSTKKKDRVSQEHVDNNQFIEIYPNPAIDNFYLNIGFLKGQAGTVEILTTEGEKISKISFEKDHKDSLKIEINDLKNGDYMVCVKTKGNDFYMDHLIVRK